MRFEPSLNQPRPNFDASGLNYYVASLYDFILQFFNVWERADRKTFDSLSD